jgi:nucleoside-diphosphate-sugar epimerase
MTGHTKGLGNILYKYLTEQGHEVVGVSRTTGHDLKDDETVEYIIKEAENYDVFINNTFQFNRQLELVKALRGKTRIVSFGSIASMFSKNVEWNIYGQYKKELEDYHREQSSCGAKDILLINITETTIEKHSQSIIKMLEYWVENPSLTFVEFNNDIM